MKKLLILSGPSCVGKGPLLAALKQARPDLAYGEIPVIRSWESRNNKPRPGEDFSDPNLFLPEAGFAGLNPEHYFTGTCRGFQQAIDLRKIAQCDQDLLIMEVYHTIGAQFQQRIQALAQEKDETKRKADPLHDVAVKTVFISPVSQKEIDAWTRQGYLQVDGYITEIMLNKQIRRHMQAGGKFTKADLYSFIARAEDAPIEMGSKPHYDAEIVCHDGEDSPNWHNGPGGTPTGGAAKALKALMAIIAAM